MRSVNEGNPSVTTFRHDAPANANSGDTDVLAAPAVTTFHHAGADHIYAFVRGADNHLHICLLEWHRPLALA